MRIAWLSGHESVTGYGSVARGMKQALRELGHSVNETEKSDVRVWHNLPYPSIGNCNAVYTMFELKPALQEWGPVLDTAEIVFTGSKWSAECLQAVTKTPVIPVGHGISIDHDVEPLTSFDKFTFLCVAELVPRKFLPILVKAFEDEFKEDDVELHVKTYSVNKNPALLFTGRRKVAFLGGMFDEMGGLYKSYDGYALPSMEGWGLTQMEAIACGIKPVVLEAGGVMDFCNEKNAWLVEPDPPENAPIDPSFSFIKPYMTWQKPNYESLRKTLRDAYENHEPVPDAELKRFRKKWTWKNVARKLVKELEDRGIEEDIFL